MILTHERARIKRQHRKILFLKDPRALLKKPQNRKAKLSPESDITQIFEKSDISFHWISGGRAP